MSTNGATNGPVTCAHPPAQGHARGRRGGAMFGLILVCAHCSLTVVGAIGLLLLGAVGVGLTWVEALKWAAPPVILIGVLGFLFFGGRLLERTPGEGAGDTGHTK